MNSGYAQDSRGLFGPSGADQRKAQDGCQNGQQRLDALVRTSPAMAPNGAFFHEPRVNRGDVVDLSLLPRISLGIYTGFTRDALWASPTEANSGLRTAGPSGPIFDERQTTYDERSFPRPIGPNINISLNIRRFGSKRLENH